MTRNLVVLIGITIPTSLPAAGQIAASEVLDKYDVARARTTAFSAKGITTVESVGQSGTSFSYTESLFRTDGARVHHQYSQWRYLTSRDAPRTPSDSEERAYLWDGRSSFEYRKEKDFDGRLFITGNDNLRKGLVSIGYGGAPLMGIFHADHDSIGSILRNASEISLRPRQELVGTSPCFIIDAVTDHGRYAVWIDPQHGYNIAKADVHKKEGDMAWGKPLGWVGNVDNIALKGRTPEPYTDIRFSITNVAFKKINDVWVPVEADYESTASRKSSTSTIKTHYQCTDIELNPDFDTIDAFVPNIPNGTRTYILESQGIAYEWRDGRPVPLVDQDFLSDLDQSVTSVKGHPGDSNQADEIPAADTRYPANATSPSEVQMKTDEAASNSQPQSRSSIIWVAAGACLVVAMGLIVYRKRRERQ